MNFSKRKIALLISALIIGQSITVQNMLGMDVFGGENTEQDELHHVITNICSTIVNAYNDAYKSVDTYLEMYNATATQSQFRNKPGFRLIPGIGICDALNDGAKTAYASALTWYTSDAPHFVNTVSTITNKDFWVKALPIIHNNAVQYVENIKNIPNATGQIIENRIDATIDILAKKAVFSVTKYGLAMSTALFAIYKTYAYCVNQYYAYQKECALNASIKQYLTDEKIAEIEQLTGKELSSNDLQEIINNIKTKITTSENGCATEATVEQEIKEYVAQHTYA